MSRLLGIVMRAAGAEQEVTGGLSSVALRACVGSVADLASPSLFAPCERRDTGSVTPDASPPCLRKKGIPSDTSVSFIPFRFGLR